MAGECGREGGGQDGVEWGVKWDNCNSIINKYILKKNQSHNFSVLGEIQAIFLSLLFPLPLFLAFVF